MGAFDQAWGLLKSDVFDDPTSAEYQQRVLDDFMNDFRTRERTLSSDPLRMKGQDIQSQLEDISTEMTRRRDRRELKDLFNEDGTSKREFDKYAIDLPSWQATRRDEELPIFDQDRPQNERMMAMTGPDLRARIDALNAELKRRAENRSPFEEAVIRAEKRRRWSP